VGDDGYDDSHKDGEDESNNNGDDDFDRDGDDDELELAPESRDDELLSLDSKDRKPLKRRGRFDNGDTSSSSVESIGEFSDEEDR
jgi:hypothetical protein